MPCLRRAAAVDYTDADEDAEKLLSFLDEVSCPVLDTSSHSSDVDQAEEAPGPDGKAKGGDDDWVATHISRGKLV